MNAYEFSFSKARLVLLAICLLASGLLLFGSGMVTALLLDKPASQIEIRQPGTPAAAAKPATKETPEAGDVKSPAALTAPPSSAAAPLPTAAPKRQPEKDLFIQVASFRNKVRADRMAESLKRQGFEPVSVTDSLLQQETWHVVRIGPYQDWDTAARTAAEVNVAFSIRTSLMNATGNAAN